jgi:hypothetical protein
MPNYTMTFLHGLGRNITGGWSLQLKKDEYELLLSSLLSISKVLLGIVIIGNFILYVILASFKGLA